LSVVRTMYTDIDGSIFCEGETESVSNL
jgi:hypothetical protein